MVGKKYWYIMYYITYHFVPFQGPKKSRFSGPTPSNAPCNDVAPLKIITYRAIKTTGTLKVILGHMYNNKSSGLGVEWGGSTHRSSTEGVPPITTSMYTKYKKCSLAVPNA